MTLDGAAPDLTLRPAAAGDSHAIATVWHAAWRDGHLGHVPDQLHPYRTLEHFQRRVPQRIANTTVAMVAGRVVGFVTVHDEELEQIFVVSAARGTGAAAALLRCGERLIATQFDNAWLAVVAGNRRARRFYEREGWSDAGPIRYAAEIVGGSLAIDTHR
ncbi:MAG TPA: GNAT family N-acetyltransferase, partial [Polyangiales bacterium]|nr:GNAT family N-acetyltransferase [Polyangiales bacterium]